MDVPGGHMDVPGAPPGVQGRGAGIVAASLGSVASSLTVFLVGALAVQIRPSLGLSLKSLGLAVSIYYLCAAVASVPAGRLAEWLGGARSMRAAALGAALSLALLAGLARSWGSFVAILVVAALMDATMQPSANLFLIRRIPPGRRGMAFGVKQAAVPFTSLLGGLAVPVLALTVGWRWAFAGGAALAAVAVVVIPRPQTTMAERRRTASSGEVDLLPLLVLAVGFGLSMLSVTALTTFLAISAVAAGIGKGTAGLLIALAGAVAVVVRVAVGIGADRIARRQIPLVCGMLVLGATGYLLLAGGAAHRLTPLIALGAVVAYGAGWGWNGLFNLAVSVNHPSAPAKASGITLTGNRLAGIAGPLLFALLATHASYSVAWIAAAASSLASAAVFFLGDRLLIASQARTAASPPRRSSAKHQ